MTAPAYATAPSTPRYGWVIVASAFVIMGITGGLTFYAMSAFINALVDDRGFSLAVASAGPTMSSAFGGLGGLFTARLMRRMAVRKILFIGIAGLSVSIALIGASHTVWQLWGAFALSGWFGAMASGIPVSSMVARWFPVAPAKPLVFAMTGMSFGGAVIPPIVLAVISGFGLTTGSMLLAVAMFLFVGAAVCFIKDPPASIIAGGAAKAQASSSSLMSKVFVLLMAGMLCLFMSQIATTMHMIRLANENNTGGAAMAATVLAIGSFAGRLGGIPLLPAIGLRTMAVAVALTQGAAQFVLSGAYSEAHLFVGMFLLGLAMGNVAILSSLFIIEAYGLSDYPRMMARIQLAGPIGSGIGPIMVALLHGATGGYRVPMIVMGVISLIGGVALFATGIDSASRLRDRRNRRKGIAPQEIGIDLHIAEEVALASADDAGVVGEPSELIAEAERELARDELSRR